MADGDGDRDPKLRGERDLHLLEELRSSLCVGRIEIKR